MERAAVDTDERDDVGGDGDESDGDDDDDANAVVVVVVVVVVAAAAAAFVVVFVAARPVAGVANALETRELLSHSISALSTGAILFDGDDDSIGMNRSLPSLIFTLLLLLLLTSAPPAALNSELGPHI